MLYGVWACMIHSETPSRVQHMGAALHENTRNTTSRFTPFRNFREHWKRTDEVFEGLRHQEKPAGNAAARLARARGGSMGILAWISPISRRSSQVSPTASRLHANDSRCNTPSAGDDCSSGSTGLVMCSTQGFLGTVLVEQSVGTSLPPAAPLPPQQSHMLTPARHWLCWVEPQPGDFGRVINPE